MGQKKLPSCTYIIRLVQEYTTGCQKSDRLDCLSVHDHFLAFLFISSPYKIISHTLNHTVAREVVLINSLGLTSSYILTHHYLRFVNILGFIPMTISSRLGTKEVNQVTSKCLMIPLFWNKLKG